MSVIRAAAERCRPRAPIPIPPVTPREPGQSGSRLKPPEVAPPVAARASAELEAVIAELREDIATLKVRDRLGPRGPPGMPGADGDDADCTAVTAKLDALAGRIEALEAKLTPDANGELTGLPPLKFIAVERGKIVDTWTKHLGGTVPLDFTGETKISPTPVLPREGE